MATSSNTNSQAPAGANNFYKSETVTLEKVTFKTQYGIRVAGNMVVPRSADRNTRYLAAAAPSRANRASNTNIGTVTQAKS